MSEQLTATLRDLAKAGSQIQAAATAGGNATTVSGVSLNLADTSRLLARARAAAVRDAQAKASQFARGLGRSLGPVLSVSDQSQVFPYPEFSAAAASQGCEPIGPGLAWLAAGQRPDHGHLRDRLRRPRLARRALRQALIRWRHVIDEPRLVAPPLGGPYARSATQGDRPASGGRLRASAPGPGLDRQDGVMLDPSVDYSADFGAQPPRGVTRFVTAGGIEVTRTVAPFEPGALAEITSQIDTRRGGTFSSGMEYPGRYSRWHIGYVDPCIEFAAQRPRADGDGAQRTRDCAPARDCIGAGARWADPGLRPAAPGKTASGQNASGTTGDADETGTPARVSVFIPEPAEVVPEEERSRRPTVFSAIREVIALFAGPDEHLGLYGAFGYDLAFQFEPITLRPRQQARPAQRDLVLHLPDEIYVIDRKRETALRYCYDFASGGRSTRGLDRATPVSAPARRTGTSGARPVDVPDDPEPGSYAGVVDAARERFAAGDLFEVVPSHEFWARCGSPAAFYEAAATAQPRSL